MLIAKVKGAQAALQRYTEFKKSGSANDKVDEGTLNGLGYTLLCSGQTAGRDRRIRAQRAGISEVRQRLRQPG